MERKEGISLIVLIITIIVIIILATAVILSLSNSNVIDNAKNAKFLNNAIAFKTELDMYHASQYSKNKEKYTPSNLYAFKESAIYNEEIIPDFNIYNIIPSLEKSSEKEKFEVNQGILIYTGGEYDKVELLDSIRIKSLPICVSVNSENITTYLVMADGTVKAWGDGTNGELGDSKTNYQIYPTIIEGLTNVKQIINPSYGFVLALLKNGTVKVWGDWGDDQYVLLQETETSNFLAPTIIEGLTNVKQITMSGCNILALLNDGRVMALGRNENGQLGNGTTTPNYIPTIIPGLSNVKQISSTLVLLNDGRLMAWGNNEYGQLLDGTTENRSSPITISGLTNVEQIFTKWGSSFVILSNGRVMAWGNNEYCQLGDGTTENRSSPITIPGLSNVKQVFSSYLDTFAIMKDGTVKAWGYNQNGVMNSSSVPVNSPVVISDLTNIKQIAPGGVYNTVALMNDGTIKTAGLAETSGNDNRTLYTTPLTNIKKINSDYSGKIILFNDGTVKKWTNSEFSKLKNAETASNSISTTITKLENIKDIYLYDNGKALILFNDYTVKKWSEASPELVAVEGLINVKQIVITSSKQFALLNDGTVKVWSNSNPTPTTISNLTNVKQIAANSHQQFYAYLLNNGTVIYTYDNVNFTTVVGLTNVKQIAVRYDIKALKNDGTIKHFNVTNSQITELSPWGKVSGANKIIQGYDFMGIILNDDTSKYYDGRIISIGLSCVRNINFSLDSTSQEEILVLLYNGTLKLLSSPENFSNNFKILNI